MNIIENPFSPSEIEEIHLPNAPLVKVIAQVRFPTIVSIENAGFIAKFQESLRHDYPVLTTEKNLIVNLLNIADKRESTMWRFFDKDKKWRVTLAPEFLAIETSEYKSRADFFKRFSSILQNLNAHIKPDGCDRIGVRYIDQIKDAEFKKIETLIRPEVMGVHGSNLNSYISSSLRQTVFNIKDDLKLTARWGVLGKNQTYDPGSVPPINNESWILDLDVFSDKKQEFALGNILSNAEEFAKYAYKFFRWTVKDEFITTYGGELR